MKLLVRIAALLVLAATPAWPASIGLYSDAGCSSCNLTVPFVEYRTLYIMFTGASSTPPFDELGLSLVEFRVVGLPAGWFVTSVRAISANVSVGDPFDRGVALGFGSPQTGDCILLYTVSIGATSIESDVILEVTRHEFPGNINFQCPNAIPWNPPINGSRTCVGAGAMFVNSSRECQVSARPTTWSQVKQQYE
jgi:hypothetical protein